MSCMFIFSTLSAENCNTSIEPLGWLVIIPDLKNLANLDTGATHNDVAALLHAAPGACFVFVVRCSVGVLVASDGMYVCGPACCACCGVLQRRHNSDAFLKCLGGPPRVSADHQLARYSDA